MSRSKYFVCNAIRVLCLVPIIVLSFSCEGDYIEIENSSCYDLILEFEDVATDSVEHLASILCEGSYELNCDQDFDSLVQVLTVPAKYNKALIQLQEDYRLISLFSLSRISFIDTNNKKIEIEDIKLNDYYKDTLSIIDDLIRNEKFVLFLPAGFTFKSSAPVPTWNRMFSCYDILNIYIKKHFIGCVSHVSAAEFDGPHFKDGKLKIEIENNHIKALINRNNKYYN